MANTLFAPSSLSFKRLKAFVLCFTLPFFLISVVFFLQVLPWLFGQVLIGLLLGMPVLVAIATSLVVMPIAVVVLRGWVHENAQAARHFGRNAALWTRRIASSGALNDPANTFEFLIMEGWSVDLPIGVVLPGFLQMGDDRSVRSFVSCIYSWAFISLDEVLSSPWGILATIVAPWAWVFKGFMRGFRRPDRVMILWLFLTWVLFNLPVDTIANVADFAWLVFVQIVSFASGPARRALAIEWFKWRVARAVSDLALLTAEIDFAFKARALKRGSERRRRFAVVFRQAALRSVGFIQSMRLPSFIRGALVDHGSIDALEVGRQIMADAGWPVNVTVTTPDLDAPLTTVFRDWLLCGSSFATGIQTMKTAQAEDIDILQGVALAYRRSEEYQSVQNETQATSRYFKTANYQWPENFDVDDVFVIVADIFKNSVLTPFGHIIHKWEKKYALGFFMTEVNAQGRIVKAKRRNFMRKIGYAAFNELWAKTFAIATKVPSVSHISVKGEALPPRKWLEGKVRSITGSPLAHYIMSTVINYHPNHNFAWDTTPIKIGMPLNGYWMDRIWSKHAQMQHHFEGDFSDFDSTVSGKVVDIIKAVRKKGFDHHKDQKRICELIDHTYNGVSNMLLGQTSTGNIWKKGTGLSTGHSSTGMDNSLALLTIYVMAWKELTNLSAIDFMHFNELSNYGDDHLLSFSSLKPSAWNARNIMKVMSKWGVTNNMVAKNLTDMEFLSKVARKPNANDRALFREHGIAVPGFVVAHNREKLLGKMSARPKNAAISYRVTRLISYLSLTAHHKDIYDSMVSTLRKNPDMQQFLKQGTVKIPSYASILKNWHAPSPAPFHEDIIGDSELALDSNSYFFVGTPTLVDELLGALSVIPDLLNPVYFNFGFERNIQFKLRSGLDWVISLLAMSNEVNGISGINFVLQNTVYSFLDVSVVDSTGTETDVNTLLLRHWLFLIYYKLVPRPKFGLRMLQFFVSKMASIQFGINARLHSRPHNYNLSFDYLLVVFALSFVRCPVRLPWVRHFWLPDITQLIELLSSVGLGAFWQRVPTSYGEVIPLINKSHPMDNPILVEAPTGTGKSTSFVVEVANRVVARKVVVIVPRVLLASSLASYVSSAFGAHCTAGHEGSIFDSKAKIWYCTYQWFWHARHLVNSSDVIILDECHLEEQPCVFTRFLLADAAIRIVMVTGTPSANNLSECSVHISLPIARLWKRTESRFDTDVGRDGCARSYATFVANHSRQTPDYMRVAYIMDTPTETEIAASKCHLPSAQIFGGQYGALAFHSNVKRIFATNVIEVGVTLPDLDMIVFPDWNYAGNGNRYMLDSLAYQQRAGRVGRVRNGHVLYWCSNANFPPAPPAFAAGTNWVHLLSQGYPLDGLVRLNPTAFWTSLNIGAEDVQKMSQDRKRAVLRSIDLLVKNHGPLGRAVRLGQQSADEPFKAEPERIFVGLRDDNIGRRPYRVSNAEEYSSHFVALVTNTVGALFGRIDPGEAVLSARWFDNFGTLISFTSSKLVQALINGADKFLSPDAAEARKANGIQVPFASKTARPDFDLNDGSDIHDLLKVLESLD